MRVCAFSALIAFVGFAAGCGKKPDGTPSGGSDDKAAVQGEWAVLKVDTGEKDGAFIEEMMKEATITVKDNLITAGQPKGMGGKDEQSGYATFTMDSSKSPKEIQFTKADANGAPKPSKKEGRSETVRGIYKLEGGTITIAIAMSEKQARPTEFKSVMPKDGGGADDPDGVIVLQLKKK